jgi:hypothetical protein
MVEHGRQMMRKRGAELDVGEQLWHKKVVLKMEAYVTMCN